MVAVPQQSLTDHGFLLVSCLPTSVYNFVEAANQHLNNTLTGDGSGRAISSLGDWKLHKL